MKEVLTLTFDQLVRAPAVFSDLSGYLIGHLNHPLTRWDDIDGTIHVVCHKCSGDGNSTDSETEA